MNVSVTSQPITIATSSVDVRKGYTQDVACASTLFTPQDVETTIIKAYGDATVFDIESGEVTRYRNYPFIGIGMIEGSVIGLVQGDSYPYLIGWETDAVTALETEALSDTTPIVAYVTTKESNYSTPDTKNVPYLYIDCDGEATVMSTVDGQNKLIAKGTRMINLAKGNFGRFWKFTISVTNKLTGLSFEPVPLQRKTGAK